MDGIDFSGLVAKAVAELDEVRACLLFSRDGLTLGAYPESGEERARQAWNRLGSVGDPERGFLVMTDEVWVFARRGAYACIVVGSSSAKAGLLLDRMEAILRAAEEGRLHPGSAPSPSTATRRPRTPLHREVRSEPEPADQVLEEVAKVLRVPDEATPAAPEASTAPPAPLPVRNEPVVPPADVAPPPVDPTPPTIDPTPPPVPELLAPDPVVSEPLPVPDEPSDPAAEAAPDESVDVTAPEGSLAPSGQTEESAEVPPIFVHPTPPPVDEGPRYTPPPSLLDEAGFMAAPAPNGHGPTEDAIDDPATSEPVLPPAGFEAATPTEDGDIDAADLAREFARLFDEPTDN